MKYKCKYCGNEFSEKFPFCPHCGNEMVYPEETIVVETVVPNTSEIADYRETTKPVEEKKKFHITSILGFAFSLAAPFGLAILVISQSLPEQLYVLFGLFGLAIACGLTVAGFVLSIIGIKKSTNRIFGILGTVFGGLNVVIGSYYAVICCIALWFAFAALFTIATL